MARHALRTGNPCKRRQPVQSLRSQPLMRPIGDPEKNWQAAPANALARARALQKPSTASDLLGKSRQPREQRPGPEQKDSSPSLAQAGTEDPVSFRHDPPRLTAGFTAQLLGQILPDPERPRSVAKAYGCPGRRRLRPGFDELL